MEVPEEMTLWAQAAGLVGSSPGVSGRGIAGEGGAWTKGAGAYAGFRPGRHALARNERHGTGGDAAGRSAGGPF